MAPAWGWYGGVAVSLWWYPPSAYVFCPTRYAFSYHVHTHIVHDHHMVHDVAAHTRNYADGRRAARRRHAAACLPANSAPPRGPSLQTRAHSRVRCADDARAGALGFGIRRRRARVPRSLRRGRSRRTFSTGSRPLAPSAALWRAARLDQQLPSSHRSPTRACTRVRVPRTPRRSPVAPAARRACPGARSRCPPRNTARRPRAIPPLRCARHRSPVRRAPTRPRPSSRPRRFILLRRFIPLRLSIRLRPIRSTVLRGADSCVELCSWASPWPACCRPALTTTVTPVASWMNTRPAGDNACGPETPVQTWIDVDAQIDTRPGEGAGVFVEYAAGGHWRPAHHLRQRTTARPAPGTSSSRPKTVVRSATSRPRIWKPTDSVGTYPDVPAQLPVDRRDQRRPRRLHASTPSRGTAVSVDAFLDGSLRLALRLLGRRRRRAHRRSLESARADPDARVAEREPPARSTLRGAPCVCASCRRAGVVCRARAAWRA